jgi:hypothetical protein
MLRMENAAQIYRSACKKFGDNRIITFGFMSNGVSMYDFLKEAEEHL